MTDATAAASAVYLRVLGPSAATVGGRDVALGGPSARAVLARLAAAAGRVVSTDLLIDDLWAGQPPPKALSALQVHVSNLRRVLEPARAPRTPATVIVSAPPGYALRLPPESVDAWHFERLVVEGLHASDLPTRIALLSQALDLWRGVPYHECVDADWARIESERLTELHDTALETRAHAYLDEGKPALVVDELGRHATRNPGREHGVRLLALALYRTGRQADSLETLRRTRAYLADELGVDPSAELQGLERDILHQEPSLTMAPATPTDRAPATQEILWDEAPVTGRGEELDALRLAARQSAREGLHLVWIGGDAGEGKSTLAQAFADEAAGSGWQVAWGRCPEVDGAPSGWPWLEVLRQFGDEDAGTPFEVGRRVEARLTAAGARTLIVLDDVHRADEPTLQVLRHLAATGRRSTSVLLCTFRPTEAAADLQATWAATAGIPGSRLTLRGLGREGAAAIARQSGVADVDDALLTDLIDRTGGNPLFIREYSRLIASEGAAAIRTTVPDGVRDVLGRRISRLPEKTVVELRRAAVLGREADLAVLAAIGEIGDDDLLDSLEPALLTGIIVEPSPDRVRFSHDLVRETLYDSVPRMRRRRMHASALSALATHSPADTAALAYHAVESATPTTAVDALHYVRAGARDAESQASYRDALALWKSAESLCEMSIEPDPSQLVEILIPRVGVQARTGDVVGARETYRRAIRIAQERRDPDALLRALVSWDAPVVWTIRVEPDVDTFVLDAIDGAAGREGLTASDRARLLSARVFELEGIDDESSLAAAREARRVARESGDTRALMRALNAFGYIAFGPDLADERITNAEELLAAARAEGDEGFVSVAYFQRFLAATAGTDFELAYHHAELATRHAAGHQLSQMLGVVAVFEAMVELMAGRLESAEHRFTAISTAMHEQGVASAQWIATIGRLGVGVARGDLSGLAGELGAIESVRPQAIRFPLILALLDGGDVSAATELWASSTPYPRDYYWLGMTAFRARAAARLGDVEVARRTYEELLPFAGRIAGLDSGSLYAGPVDAALGDVAELLGDDDAAVRWRAAASDLVKLVSERLRERESTAPR
ncbi:BTAD domain-containing putative transcriptional regulator [Rhodococcus sp. UNC363MFTsu5.1]|uniref:BTAD domain-containing putative transcriptional regulator n=1 Tax=Rhodococcus sp. UNC363MFTsu5.1 TaxID=1449069 RepID=UPI000562B823|nr:BTAD domain-containing putative transcriptional regulator [Rhodococcus sp. UNC363MFTsu5.1]